VCHLFDDIGCLSSSISFCKRVDLLDRSLLWLFVSNALRFLGLFSYGLEIINWFHFRVFALRLLLRKWSFVLTNSSVGACFLAILWVQMSRLFAMLLEVFVGASIFNKLGCARQYVRIGIKRNRLYDIG